MGSQQQLPFYLLTVMFRNAITGPCRVVFPQPELCQYSEWANVMSAQYSDPQLRTGLVDLTAPWMTGFLTHDNVRPALERIHGKGGDPRAVAFMIGFHAEHHPYFVAEFTRLREVFAKRGSLIAALRYVSGELRPLADAGMFLSIGAKPRLSSDPGELSLGGEAVSFAELVPRLRQLADALEQKTIRWADGPDFLIGKNSRPPQSLYDDCLEIVGRLLQEQSGKLMDEEVRLLVNAAFNRDVDTESVARRRIRRRKGPPVPSKDFVWKCTPLPLDAPPPPWR